MRVLRVLLASALVWLAFGCSTADAHHPEVTATVECADTGLSIVHVHTEAWKDWPGFEVTPDRRYNSSIEVRWRVSTEYNDYLTPAGDAVYSQFVPSNDYQFDATFVVPTNLGIITVRSTAIHPWGPNGEYPGVGEYREAEVVLPQDCGASVVTTTTPIPTPTSSAPTPTPDAPPSNDTKVIERTPSPGDGVPVPEAPEELAATGSNSTQLVIIALVMLAVGGMIVQGTRRYDR